MPAVENHNEAIKKYKTKLSADKSRHLETLDALSREIGQLQSGPANSAIIQLNYTAKRVKELEVIQDYLLTAVKINELADLVEAQSDDLSTVSMALDCFEQLILIHAEIRYERLKAKLFEIITKFRLKLTTDFKKWLHTVMERVKWPIPPKESNLELLLLTCQTYRLFELISASLISSESNASDDSGSNCIRELVRPIAAQFHFHFSCDRPTNRLDKPEWVLEFMLGVCEEHLEFLTELDELLSSHSFKLFIDELIEIVRGRFLAQKESIMGNFLLPHVVEQIVSFGDQLAERYNYQNGAKSLLSVFLSSPENVSRWIELERHRLLDAYEDAIAGIAEYSAFDPLLDFLGAHYEYLKSLGMLDIQSQLLYKVTIPILEQLLQKIEFDIPAFVTKSSDATSCCRMYNACMRLKTMIGVDWGEDLAMILLSQSEPCHSAFGYDPSVKVGTVFWKAVEALSGIEEMTVGRLYSYLKDVPLSLLARWSSAMHYSRPEAPTIIHDSLRQALLEIPQRASVISETITSTVVFAELFARFVREFEEAIHHRFIIRNYFSFAGAEAFYGDVKTIESVFSSILRPSHSSWLLAGKLADCMKLLRLPEAEGTHSAMILKRLLQNDKLSEANRLLAAIGVEKLTLAECEQVLASRR